MAPTWETAADWDSPQSETGTHHEQPAGADWAPSDQIEKGYPSDWTNTSLPTPDIYYPLDEDSGSTANDVMGTADGTITGATLGAGGVGGTTAYDFDGTDDNIQTSYNIDSYSSLTIALWLYVANFDTNRGIVTWGEDGSYGEIVFHMAQNSAIEFHVGNGNSLVEASVGSERAAFGTWTFAACSFEENNQVAAYFDTQSNGFSALASSTTSFTTKADPSSTMQVGNWVRTGDAFPGVIDEVLIWGGTALSASQLATVRDAMI